jgi:hypothetical protein
VLTCHDLRYAGPGTSVKGWPAGEKNKYPQAHRGYQKEGSDEWVTNKVYIANRNLRREVNRQVEQNRADERAQSR